MRSNILLPRDTIHVAPRDLDAVLSAVIARCTNVELVDSLDELHEVLERHAGRPPRTDATLDLIGHSTTSARLLKLGGTLLDMCDPAVEDVFRSIARDRLFARVGIVALRLHGCGTAVAPAAQHTLRRLAATLRVPVFGTTKSLIKSHYDGTGLNPAFSHLLVEAASIRGPRPAGRGRDR